MKHWVAVVLLVFIAACSDSHNNDAKSLEISEDIVELEAINYSVAPEISIPENQNLNFATVAYKLRVSQTIKLTNTSAFESLIYSSEDIDSSSIAPFVVSNNSCVGTLSPRKSCAITIDLSNSAPLISDTPVSASISIKNVPIMLSAVLQRDLTDYNAASPDLIYSPSSIDFGTVLLGSPKELAVIVKNNGLKSLSLTMSSISNSNVSITSNTCPNTISSRKSCSLKLKYTTSSAETFNNIQLLNMGTNALNYSVIAQVPSAEVPEVISVNPITSTATIALTPPNPTTGNIVFRNDGTSTFASPVSVISSHAGIEITSTTCSNGLSRGKTCIVSYSANPSVLPPSNSIQTIKIQSGTKASSNFSLTVNAQNGSGFLSNVIWADQPMYDNLANGGIVANAYRGSGGTYNHVHEDIAPSSADFIYRFQLDYISHDTGVGANCSDGFFGVVGNSGALFHAYNNAQGVTVPVPYGSELYIIKRNNQMTISLNGESRSYSHSGTCKAIATLRSPGDQINKSEYLSQLPSSGSGRYWGVQFSNFDVSGGSFVLSEIGVVINGQYKMLSEVGASIHSHNFNISGNLSNGSFTQDASNYAYSTANPSYVIVDLGSVQTIDGLSIGVTGFDGSINGMEWFARNMVLKTSDTAPASINNMSYVRGIIGLERSSFGSNARYDLLTGFSGLPNYYFENSNIQISSLLTNNYDAMTSSDFISPSSMSGYGSHLVSNLAKRQVINVQSVNYTITGVFFDVQYSGICYLQTLESPSYLRVYPVPNSTDYNMFMSQQDCKSIASYLYKAPIEIISTKSTGQFNLFYVP